ncbi:MAG TPA: phosphoenolpyruvate--protein phosphotransferase [Thermoanaerobaculia bacterium]|nr:phosphoenolpyruvate--protein phosphotransferase [Thermoanaerobaculia bacterium]
MTTQRMQILSGMGVAGGIAIGRAVCISTRVSEIYRFTLEEEAVESEIERLRAALQHAQGELQRIRCRAGESLGDDLAAIFDAHILLLSDRSFAERIEGRIRTQRVNAEWAVHKTAEELDDRFSKIDDAYLRERSEDLTDVSRHLLRSLQGLSQHELSKERGDAIIVADDLTPSDTVRLGRELVKGFVIESGGRTSHTTIIARSLNIPAVSGITGITGVLTDDDTVIVDGENGTVILHPTDEVLAEYRHRRLALADREREMLETRELDTVTRDGVWIALMANIDLPEEIAEVQSFGAAGVGLYRSEFLYIEKSPHLPTEEDHLEIYRRLVEAAAPHPAIIRTYDLGGRKLAREVMATHEDNPVLGLRGIRLTLARPDVFKTQLRGLYRASVYGDLWVMLPLVSTLDELRRFRSFAAEICDELEREGLPFRHDLKIGVMIEVPAAAMIADLLAQEVDFFSIGTNDLIQYSLAVDRNNEHVADLYQPLHPAILRMLRFVIDSGRAAGIEISLCGEMAADERYAPLLIGLGLRRLSVAPRLVPSIKTRIRELAATELASLADQCMAFRTASEVQRHVESYLEGALSLLPGRP